MSSSLPAVGDACAHSPRARSSQPPSPSSPGLDLPVHRSPGVGLDSPSHHDGSDCSLGLGTLPSNQASPHPRPVFDEHIARDLLYQRGEIDRPENTKKAVEPKILEWQKYIDHTHIPVKGGREGAQHLPTKENTYKLMLYQALRGQRKKGGKRKRKKDAEEDEQEDDQQAAQSSSRGFSGAEYDSIMTQFHSGDAHILLSNPSNPIGDKMFQHYKLALLHLSLSICPEEGL